MNRVHATSIALILAAAGFVLGDLAAYAQAPAGGAAAPAPQAPGVPPGGGGGGGRGGGLPGATPEQTQAVMDMNAALTALTTAVTTARTELATVTFADVKNVAGITAAVEKLRVAELALAMTRADEFAKLQAGPNKLNPDQISALIAAGGNPTAGRGGRGGPGAGGAGRGVAPGAGPGAAPGGGAGPGAGAPAAPAGRGRAD